MADLYDQFHTNVNGTGPLSDAQSALYNQAEAYEQVRDNLTQALGSVKASYTGSAADAMNGAFTPLADSFNDGANFAGRAGLAIGLQIGNFATAQAKITKPMAVPAAPFYEDIDPFDTAHDDAVNKNAQIDSANEAAYNTYGADTQGARGWLEPVPPETSGFGTFTVTQNGSGLVVGAPPGAGGSVGSGGGSTGSVPTSPVGHGPGGTASPPHNPAESAPNPPARPGPVNGDPPAAPIGSSPTPPAGGPGSPPPGTVLSSAPTDPGLPGTGPAGQGGTGATGGVGGFGSGTGGTDGPFGSGGAGSLVGGGGLSGEPLSGGAFAGESPSSGPPARGSLSGGSLPGNEAAGAGRGGLGTGTTSGTQTGGLTKYGAGSRSGITNAAAAAEDAEPGGRPGATGQSGAGGMGGAGRGRQEDDTEHQTASYLTNADNGNQIVGSFDPVAPSVIGEFGYDDEVDR
jgi:hypothetical protein